MKPQLCTELVYKSNDTKTHDACGKCSMLKREGGRFWISPARSLLRRSDIAPPHPGQDCYCMIAITTSPRERPKQENTNACASSSLATAASFWQLYIPTCPILFIQNEQLRHTICRLSDQHPFLTSAVTYSCTLLTNIQVLSDAHKLRNPSLALTKCIVRLSAT